MLQINDQAPLFALKNQNDDTIRLEDFKGKKVVLYFYPKDNTPGCTAQACSFRDYNDLLKEINVVVLGISFDNLQSHEKFHNKHQLNFDILVDEKKEVAQKYGVYQEKQMFGKKHMGIVRSTFIINEQGLIEKIMMKISAKNNPKEVYEYLKSR